MRVVKMAENVIIVCSLVPSTLRKNNAKILNCNYSVNHIATFGFSNKIGGPKCWLNNRALYFIIMLLNMNTCLGSRRLNTGVSAQTPEQLLTYDNLHAH